MYIHRMVRTQLYLDETVHRRLQDLARKQGRTISDLVRDALVRAYGAGADERESTLRAIEGLWRNRGGIGDLHAVRLGIAREVHASPTPHGGVQHNLAARAKERFGNCLLAGTQPRPDLRHGHGRAVGLDPGALDGPDLARDPPPASERFDQNVRVEENAGYAFSRRRRSR